MQLQYAAKRGFYLSTPKPKTATKQGGPEVPPLPKDFIQVDAMRSRSTVTCTTHKLNALNSRLSDASSDCLVLTEQVGNPFYLCHIENCWAWFRINILDLHSPHTYCIWGHQRSTG